MSNVEDLSGEEGGLPPRFVLINLNYRGTSADFKISVMTASVSRRPVPLQRVRSDDAATLTRNIAHVVRRGEITTANCSQRFRTQQQRHRARGLAP